MARQSLPALEMICAESDSHQARPRNLAGRAGCQDEVRRGQKPHDPHSSVCKHVRAAPRFTGVNSTVRQHIMRCRRNVRLTLSTRRSVISFSGPANRDRPPDGTVPATCHRAASPCRHPLAPSQQTASTVPCASVMLAAFDGIVPTGCQPLLPATSTSHSVVACPPVDANFTGWGAIAAPVLPVTADFAPGQQVVLYPPRTAQRPAGPL